MVAAYGNRVAAGGRPDFMLSGIPTNGVLGNDKTYEPRIYFGEMSPDYSIVGGPEGWDPRELDRPASGSGSQDTRNTFDGDGGPSVGNFFNRLVYSLKFASTDLLLSDAINDKSQILYDRNPKQRVEKVAPYLTVDSNAYPAIVDGRVKWIVDAYTTSKNYPYSKQQALASAVTDSLTGGTRAVAQTGQINYIRNSVKATVDAYDGSVTLYAWEPEEPLLQAWQKVFPTNIKSYKDMSAELMSHVRYPEDLFKVQRELLATLPRDRSRGILRRQRRLVGSLRPDAVQRQHQAAPVLPLAEDAEAGEGSLLADLDVHPADRRRRPAAQRALRLPGRRRRCRPPRRA